MSKIAKRKRILKEIMDDDYAPPTENQTIVRIVKSPGSNLHLVETPDQLTYLVSMPRKFRDMMYVRRGSYCVVEPIEEGDKVKAEIVKILTKDHIKYYKEDNVWPAAFEDQNEKNGGDSDNSDELFVNTNRVQVYMDSSDSDSEDSSDSDSTESEDDSDEQDSDSDEYDVVSNEEDDHSEDDSNDSDHDTAKKL